MTQSSEGSPTTSKEEVRVELVETEHGTVRRKVEFGEDGEVKRWSATLKGTPAK